jgi:hypothetical protein
VLFELNFFCVWNLKNNVCCKKCRKRKHSIIIVAKKYFHLKHQIKKQIAKLQMLKKVADSLRKRINVVVDDLFRFFIFVISGLKLSLSL